VLTPELDDKIGLLAVRLSRYQGASYHISHHGRARATAPQREALHKNSLAEDLGHFQRDRLGSADRHRAAYRRIAHQRQAAGYVSLSQLLRYLQQPPALGFVFLDPRQVLVGAAVLARPLGLRVSCTGNYDY
jgi:hypothetical protein